MVKRTDDLTKDFDEHENHICYSEGGWPLLDEHWEDCGETQIKLLDIREFSSYKDYLIQRVKKVIKSCRTKEQLFTAINYVMLASAEVADSDAVEADWLDYFQPMVFDRGKEIADYIQWELATVWVKRRYN